MTIISNKTHIANIAYKANIADIAYITRIAFITYVTGITYSTFKTLKFPQQHKPNKNGPYVTYKTCIPYISHIHIYIYMWQGPFGIMRPSSFLIPFVSILVSLSVPNLSPDFSISIAILLSGRFRSKESPCLPFLTSLSIAQCSSFWWLSG